MKQIPRFFVIAFLVLFACSTEDEVNIVYLKGINPEVGDIPFMKFPFRIGLDDSIVVILDLATDSCFYHVISYPDFQYLYSLGRRGNGPGEIILATPFQLRMGHLFLLDGNRGHLFDVDLAGKRNIDLKVHTHFDLNTCVDFVCIDDTTLILGDLSGNNRLLHAMPQSITGILELPCEQVKEDRVNQGYVWRSYMDMNYELNKVVLATQFGEVLEIVDLNDYSVRRTIGKGGVPRSATNQLAGYFDIKWRKNNIYVLYSGMSEIEVNRQLANNQRPPGGGDHIHVFDQNGVKTKIYHLDVSINGFTVDEKNNLLIGISSNSDYPVYLFNLD
ncbi:MAG: TolB-like 6-bladed beta-propeller domain-containing protein [Tannerellaceae bacterium]|jgi:hypothetical protein|nr:TolB-like 6-bladed beta-propeller domain-containing protein [Tannerellaceae bacterium]